MPFSYKVGLGNAASYQVSGKPYASGSIDATVANADGATKVGFPSVTSWIVVSNKSVDPCKIGFSANGVSNDVLASNFFFTVPSGSMSPRLELKVSELWLSGSSDVDVIAGLTGIDLTQINNPGISPSGTNWSGSTGV